MIAQRPSGRVSYAASLRCRLSAVCKTTWWAYAASAVVGLLLGFLFLPQPDTMTTRIGLLTALAAVQVGVAAWFARRQRTRLLAPAWIIAISFVIAAVLASIFIAPWPNSSDEYGVTYLADTLRHGRLWNPPAPVADLFDTFWIFEKDGKRVSQYAPGWSVVLIPFRQLGIETLGAPLALLGSGLLLASALRSVGTSTQGTTFLLTLTILAPFTLFNGASLFPMTLAGMLVLAIICLQIRDDKAPRTTNRLLIGLAFSALLTVRTEVFGILALFYGLDRVVVRGRHVFADLPAYAIGALPLTALFMAYNFAITGNPIVPPFSWVRATQSLGIGASADAFPFRTAFWNEQVWFGLLCGFGGVPLLILYGFAIARKLRSMSLRYYDLLPIGAVGFFFFFLDIGGHQFGPRYWYFAFPPMALTVAALQADEAGWISLAGWRLHGPSFASICAAGFLATTVVIAPTFLIYTHARRQVYDPLPASLPAVVLIPTRHLTVFPWQFRPYLAEAKDFTRNDAAYEGKILYGHADSPSAIDRACSLPGRSVYLWEESRTLRPVTCPGRGPGPSVTK